MNGLLSLRFLTVTGAVLVALSTSITGTGLPAATLGHVEFPGVTDTNPAVTNFSAAVGRLVTLAAVAGGGLLSLVWARVALSWFSHDSMKKVLAKERARDALIGTLLFVGAISGLIWALANWVVTGT